MKLLITTFCLLFLSVSAFARGEFCRVIIQHSSNQHMTSYDLVYRDINDAFMNVPAACSSFHSNLQQELTSSCRAKGGITARIDLQYWDGRRTNYIRSFTAFCQDLAPDLYRCNYWDKVKNVLVHSPSAACNPGGGGGDGGGDGGGGGGDGGGGGGGGDGGGA